VTLFSVILRVFPFSKLSPKNPIPKKVPNPIHLTAIPALSRRPIIKGRRADLIFFVTR
jgi:hypothetical protein